MEEAVLASVSSGEHKERFLEEKGENLEMDDTKCILEEMEGKLGKRDVGRPQTGEKRETGRCPGGATVSEACRRLRRKTQHWKVNAGML